MAEPAPGGRPAARITCIAHPRFRGRIAERLAALGVASVRVENARCVRQRVRARRWRLPEPKVRLEDAPAEIYRATVARPAAVGVLGALTRAADLDTPGRGSLFVQDILEFGPDTPLAAAGGAPAPARMLLDLALVTAIVSKAGSGEQVARSALRLGAGVPVIGLGEGTGIRDRLGLLRVTIPPEKEVVHLVVPRDDAGTIERLLIEDARMDRPGGGFLYRTPIRAGLTDPMLRIGPQDRAASIEQLVAAIDELKAGTGWRRRHADPATAAGELPGRPDGYREIVFVCLEGEADSRIRAAMRAGAGGATTTRVHGLGGGFEGGAAALERGVLCVPAGAAERVVDALRADGPVQVEMLEAPSAFAYARMRA